MQTANDLFDTLLRKRMAERAAELKERLAANPVYDMSITNHLIGRIAGLTEASELCDEVQTELSER